MGVQSMTGAKTNNRRAVAGDPLNDLLDDTSMKRSAAKAGPRVTYARSANASNVWWIAAAATLVWIAAVVAFSWARFALPGDPSEALGAAQSRMNLADWLMIVSAIAGPALLIWVIAWLVRRSMELRDESRRLAKAAIMLADAAESAERRVETMLPAPSAVGGELIANGPGHLHREIERASHAMNALQTQMSSMEVALAKQSAAFDNAAERAARQTTALSSPAASASAPAPDPAPAPAATTARSSAFAASAAAVVGAGAAGVASAAGTAKPAQAQPVPTPRADAAKADVLAAQSAQSAAHSPRPAAVDLSLDAETPADIARRDLLAAQESAGWSKLVPDDATLPPSPRPAQQAQSKRSPLEEMRDDVAAIKNPQISEPEAPQPRPETGTVDPFDDLGPSAPKAAAGAALGAGVAAMGFGATRDESVADTGAAKLGAPQLGEPAPAPQATPPKPANSEAAAEELEFMPRALDWKKFVKAANFPENERDTATLDALYEVLTDPQAAALLQSSEDTLATLADLDLYMEDFVPEMSPITAWRGHLDGKPGVLGIDAPIEQSRINAKLNADAAFRKLSDRFVNRYQVVLKRLFHEGADGRLAIELADSRTGRAYILVAGALGKLD